MEETNDDNKLPDAVKEESADEIKDIREELLDPMYSDDTEVSREQKLEALKLIPEAEKQISWVKEYHHELKKEVDDELEREYDLVIDSLYDIWVNKEEFRKELFVQMMIKDALSKEDAEDKEIIAKMYT
jgi:hypothetical protein